MEQLTEAKLHKKLSSGLKTVQLAIVGIKTLCLHDLQVSTLLMIAVSDFSSVRNDDSVT